MLNDNDFVLHQNPNMVMKLQRFFTWC